MKEAEVPKVVMGGLGRRDFLIRFWLTSVDEIWKLESILDEEDRNIVSDNIPVPLLCIKLDCKPSDISHSVGTTTASKDR